MRPLTSKLKEVTPSENSSTATRFDASQLRCLPYFFLAGFTKCGTTDMFDQLIQFSLIVPGRAKEIHFWRGAKRYDKRK